MTKEIAITIIETAGAEVLNCRMSNGTPKVTINWKDYPKIRNISEVLECEILVAMK